MHLEIAATRSLFLGTNGTRHTCSPSHCICLILNFQVDTWATQETPAEHCPYRTGRGSGAVFDAGGEWLAAEKKALAAAGMAVKPW